MGAEVSGFRGCWVLADTPDPESMSNFLHSVIAPFPAHVVLHVTLAEVSKEAVVLLILVECVKKILDFGDLVMDNDC